MDGQTLPTKIIHHGQRPEAIAVVELVADKIHTPAFVQIRGVALTGLSMGGRTIAFWPLAP